MTRLWFTISIGGSSTQDPLGWLRETVIDAQPLILDEIWTITVQDHRSTKLSTFYVLQSTCEVIGCLATTSHSTFVHASDPDFPNASSSPSTAKETLPIRSDWSNYIASRLQILAPNENSTTSRPADTPLLASLRWADHGEYERGISRHWLERTERMGEEGVALRIVAERYVLACVVGNRYVRHFHLTG